MGQAFFTPKTGRVVFCGKNNAGVVVGGFGVTPVDSEVYEEIKKVYKDNPLFANGHIFAAEKREAGDAEARAKSGLRSPFDALDPKNPGTGATPDEQKNAAAKKAAEENAKAQKAALNEAYTKHKAGDVLSENQLKLILSAKGVTYEEGADKETLKTLADSAMNKNAAAKK